MDLGRTHHDDYALIAHLTDTHLFATADGELMDVNTAQSLQSVLNDIHAFPERFDAAVVTGDLVHDETAAGYARLRDMLAVLGMPVFCLAGNHDDTALMRQVLNGGSLSTAPTFTLGQWAFRLLHTPVAGQVAGLLDDAELASLRTWLAQHTHHHVALALHHHPLPISSAWLDELALRNGAQLVEEVARQQHVKLTFWGHVHQSWDQTLHGCRWLSTPSTCAQFKPRAPTFALDAPLPGWRWLRCYNSGRIETGVRSVTP